MLEPLKRRSGGILRVDMREYRLAHLAGAYIAGPHRLSTTANYIGETMRDPDDMAGGSTVAELCFSHGCVTDSHARSAASSAGIRYLESEAIVVDTV